METADMISNVSIQSAMQNAGMMTNAAMVLVPGMM